MVDRVEFRGFSSCIPRRVTLRPVAPLTGHAEQDEDQSKDEKTGGEEQKYLGGDAHAASLLVTKSEALG